MTELPSNIILTKGDLFRSGCQCLVNPVNCVGVMGAGLAKSFKQKLPGIPISLKIIKKLATTAQ